MSVVMVMGGNTAFHTPCYSWCDGRFLFVDALQIKFAIDMENMTAIKIVS
jgi:hypothetical protein